MAITYEVDQWLRETYENHCFISWPHTINPDITECARAVRKAILEGLATSFHDPQVFLDETGIIGGAVWEIRLLIAKARGLVHEEANARTGSKGLLFVSKDESGLDTDPIDLGKNLAESGSKIDMESADFIRQHANHALERDYPLESQRAELQKQVVSTLEEVKMSRGNNVGDDVYRQLLEGGRLAVKILKREN